MLNLAAKKKHVSKKNKIAWRKHVDISDVDAFLEDQRLEERIGKPLSSLKDEELFYEDVTPATENVLSTKKQRRLKILLPPKCFSMLKSHTNVPDPITKRNRVRTKEERKNVLIKRKEEQMRLKGILKSREKQSIKDRKLAAEKKKEMSQKDLDDVWTREDIIIPEIEKDIWIDSDVVRHNLESVGKVKKRVPEAMRKTGSVLAAIDTPHPGTSYNPSYDDHQDLLKLVAEKEQNIIKEEAHLNRVTKDMFRKVTEEERDTSWIVEMSEGLLKPDEKLDENEGSDSEYKTFNPPVQNKKKTLKQRRKQKEVLKQENIRRLAKIDKKKVADIYKLRFIKKHIETQENMTKLLQEKRKKAEEYKAKEAKRLAARKYEDPDIDFNSGEDISGNLRNIRTAGNLLLDRFKSLQKRNILAPSVRKTIKKAKIKRFVKPDHKDNWKTTVANASLK